MLKEFILLQQAPDHKYELVQEEGKGKYWIMGMVITQGYYVGGQKLDSGCM